MDALAMKKIINDLWFKRRDIVSDGMGDALSYIAKLLPISIIEIPTGTECWTWIVPPKWSISEGWIHSGNKVYLDISDHPLYVMSYSQPISKTVEKDELFANLYSRPARPNAIPFEFSYYEKKWGFCIQNKRLPDFKDKNYDICIKSQFTSGSLKIGELVIPGKMKEEILVVAHLCHPYMANDNLSGVAVLIGIAKELIKEKRLDRYTYRFLFLPETIGPIAYLSQNEKLIPQMKYAIVVDCVGNDDVLSLQHSRQSTTELDICASYVFKNETFMFREGSANEVMGSDERVFSSPGVDIPSILITRTRFEGRGECPYPEYHSSDDTPDIIIPENLIKTRDIVLKILEMLDSNYVPIRSYKGLPFLSRYGLWVDRKKNAKFNSILDDLLLSLEGDKSVIEIAKELDVSYSELHAWLNKLYELNLINKK
jgi:aminopeptidase-like protein